MWKYLDDLKKSYLVLKVSEGTVEVGVQRDLKMALTHTDLNGKYLLLDGLDFKSNSKNQSILYMEVFYIWRSKDERHEFRTRYKGHVRKTWNVNYAHSLS